MPHPRHLMLTLAGALLLVASMLPSAIAHEPFASTRQTPPAETPDLTLVRQDQRVPAPTPEDLTFLETAAQSPSPSPTPRPTPKPTTRPKPTPRSVSGAWQHDPEASFFGPGLYGHRTACGLRLTKTLVGVAHRTLRCGTLVQFRNPANGRTIIVPVVDRGPYVAGRIWDLTGGACLALKHCYTGPIWWRLVRP